VKCKQRVCRPLGGTSPLSDRAPRNNGDAREPRLYGMREGNIEGTHPQSLRSPRARHVDTANERNLGDPYGVKQDV